MRQMNREMEAHSDIELAGLAQGGDAGAFSRLIERHYMLMYTVAYKWTCSREDAEDVAQEVCLKLARDLMSFKGASSFRTWLYRVAVNAAKDYIRKHSAKRKHEEEFVREHLVTGNPGRVEGSEEDPGISAEALLMEIRKLPDKYREALLLVHSEGLSHKEAGEVLGCAESTVSWRVHEGKKKLKAHLKNKKRNEHG